MKETAKLISLNSYLQSLPKAEAEQLPYTRLAEKIEQLPSRKFDKAFLQELAKKNLSLKESRQYMVNKDEAPGKSKTGYFISLIKAYHKFHCLGDIEISWQAMRDFWYRVHSKSVQAGHSDCKRLLDPICRLCGYIHFEDFLEKEFSVIDEVFRILILPFSGDILNRNDAETILQKRYIEIAQKEKLPMQVLFIIGEKQSFYTAESARKIGLKHKADIVIYGDLYLRNEEKLALQYVIISNFQQLKQREWNSQPQSFKFSQLQQGHLQNKIDYIIYWILGIQSFYNNQLKKSLRYFIQIVKNQKADEEIYYRLAVLYDLANKKAEARQAYKKALELAPHHFPSLLNLGINAVLEDDHKEARRVLSLFQQHFDNKRDSLFNISSAYLGVACKHLGEFQLAETNLLAVTSFKGKQLHSGFSEIWAMAHYELAELLYKVDQPDTLGRKKILFHLKKALELSSRKDISALIKSNNEWMEIFPDINSLLDNKTSTLSSTTTRTRAK